MSAPSTPADPSGLPRGVVLVEDDAAGASRQLIVSGQGCSSGPFCVYGVCMARLNVYLPDELADRARAAGLNVSAVTRSALEAELAGKAASGWLERLAALPPTAVQHRDVIAAVAAARDELEGHDHL